MSFRERPEYQNWRNAVFQLFGRECILCKHDGNIHAHHVRPVNTYPELAFDPRNGVPLCGNCHCEINDNEAAYIIELERRQDAILRGESVAGRESEPSEADLRERAYAEPSSTEIVEHWFDVADDSQAVIDFYNQHHQRFAKTIKVYQYLAWHLVKLERWQDAERVVDKAMQMADRDRCLIDYVEQLAFCKLKALPNLGRDSEVSPFLRGLVVRFPEVASLHQKLAIMLFRDWDVSKCSSVLDESVYHSLRAAELAPANYSILHFAAFLTRVKGDYSSSLQYAKQSLALAANDDEKVCALQEIAQVYASNKLYSDARSYLREAVQIDDCNPDVFADMAHCYFMEDNTREAVRMAKMGLMLDPSNPSCTQILGYCEKESIN